jgi:homoserine dehydrogenase
VVKIGLLGCGTIGSGVVELIGKNPSTGQQILVEKILVKNLEKHINSPYRLKLTNRFEDVLNSEIDIVVEVMGGIDPAYFYVKQSLLQGKHVVTANKDLIARYGKELQKIARERGVRLLFEASVGGGIPIIKPLSESLAANNISEIWGIVNGTTNYILSQMYNWSKSFEEALAEAQANGYAEANPEADVEGYDAGRKLAILSSIAFHKNVNYEDIHIEGISKITGDDIQLAKYLGYTIKLLAVSKKTDDRIMARVAPAMIRHTHPLAQVGNVYNAIIVKGDAVGDVLFYGQGAGKFPTASAVLGDVIDIVKNSITNNRIEKQALEELPEANVDIKDNECKFFIRLKPVDRFEAMGEIAKHFRDFEFVFPDRVKLGKVIERDQVILITSRIKEQDLEESINRVLQSGKISTILSIIRIEEAD